MVGSLFEMDTRQPRNQRLVIAAVTSQSFCTLEEPHPNTRRGVSIRYSLEAIPKSKTPTKQHLPRFGLDKLPVEFKEIFLENCDRVKTLPTAS